MYFIKELLIMPYEKIKQIVQENNVLAEENKQNEQEINAPAEEIPQNDNTFENEAELVVGSINDPDDSDQDEPEKNTEKTVLENTKEKVPEKKANYIEYAVVIIPSFEHLIENFCEFWCKFSMTSCRREQEQLLRLPDICYKQAEPAPTFGYDAYVRSQEFGVSLVFAHII